MRSNRTSIFALACTLVAALSFSWASFADPADTSSQRFASGANQVQLVELYTSQGCSSCPPADAWLSKYRKDAKLWQEIVPVSYHVNYWDYLGWTDPFASAAHSTRQRQMARRADSGVYTPGVFRNQQEWRSWRHSGSWLGGADPADRTVGILEGQLNAGRLQVNFKPAPGIRLQRPQVELVGLRTGQTTAVLAGENGGRKLSHDFVAGKVNVAALRQQDNRWVAELDIDADADVSALAFWVLDDNGNYLQATGGWIANQES